MNQKKARRRNIVPARIGYFALFFMLVYGSILIVLYMIPIEVGKEQKIKIVCSRQTFIEQTNERTFAFRKIRSEPKKYLT